MGTMGPENFMLLVVRFGGEVVSTKGWRLILVERM